MTDTPVSVLTVADILLFVSGESLVPIREIEIFLLSDAKHPVKTLFLAAKDKFFLVT